MLLNLVHAGMNSIGRNRVPSFPLTGRVNFQRKNLKKKERRNIFVREIKGERMRCEFETARCVRVRGMTCSR